MLVPGRAATECCTCPSLRQRTRPPMSDASGSIASSTSCVYDLEAIVKTCTVHSACTARRKA
eukprot:6182297-Pleurochrysis_carterae.AAC.1